MQQPYNINNNWEQPLLFLANPQKTYIKNGIIPHVKEFNLTKKFNNIIEMTFKIYEYEDGVKNEFYDLLESKRLIEAQYLGWFQIDEFPEDYLDNDPIPHKIVKCLSLENQLVNKRIDAIDGTYSLFDLSDTNHSILHIVYSLSGWNIGHIDSELLSLYRTFQIDTDMIYNFLTTTVSQSFECIFIFDTYARTISAYKLDNVGELTDIIISEANLLNKATVESFGNQITTKILVKGNDTCDIRAVNPNSTNYLINIDYYLTTEWMSQGLITGWNNYKTAYNNAQSTWSSLITSLKTKNSELTVLKIELTDLQSAQTAQYDVFSSMLQNNSGKVPPVGSSDYTIYINAKNSYDSYFSLIASKQAAITTKQAEITSVQSSLSSLSNNLSITNFLTSGQITELESFLIEGETYSDDTFVVTDTMTEEEAIQMKLELMENGAKQLAIYSHPQYTYKISAKNLFSIIDNPENVCKFEDWRDKLDIGNFVTIMLREDYWVTTRIIELDIDYNNLEEIQIVLSDKPKEDTRATQLSETLAGAGRTNAALGMYKYGYGEARNQVSDVRTFLTSSLNATLNSVVNNDNQDLLIDTYGLHMRKWLPDQNKFSDYQSWWLNNVLLFTDDGFQSATTAIGLLTAPDGSTYWGLNTEVLVGSLIMGEKMILTNSSGNYTIDNNGFQATATSGANTYLVGINPNTPANIFRIAVNGTNRLYVDTVNNRLVMNGSLVAGSIDINGRFTVDSTGACTASALTLTGGSINIGNRFVVSTGGVVTINSNSLIVNSTNFTLTADGTLTAVNGNFTGNVTSSIITGSTFTNVNSSNTQVAKIQNGIFYGTQVITTDYNSAIGGIAGTTFGVLRPGYLSVGTGTGLSFTTTIEYGEITTSSIVCTTINNGTPITTANRTSYTYPPSTHYQDSTTINPVTTGGGNVGLNGLNVASVNWVNANFQPLSSSDFRLKKNIKPLSDIPIEIYLELIPTQFEFIDDPYNKGVVFGFVAQDVIKLFEKYGFNALEYNLVEKAPIRTDIPDERKYIEDGFKYRINYTNFNAWTVLITQKLWKKVVQD